MPKEEFVTATAAPGETRTFTIRQHKSFTTFPIPEDATSVTVCIVDGEAIPTVEFS